MVNLQNQVLREEVVDYVLDRFENELTRELAKIGDEMDQASARGNESGSCAST